MTNIPNNPPLRSLVMTSPTTDVCKAFVVPADGYDRLMGRYLPTLAPAFADRAGIKPNMRVLDVGCGPGGLTCELVARVGAGAVAAIDPSPPFVAACQERNPGVDVRHGSGEQLPFDDNSFDATVSSLVVGFMSDPDAGAREMVRVTKPGGILAACFWANTGMPLLQTFWAAAASLDPNLSGKMQLLGSHEGDLAALLKGAGAADVEQGELHASAQYDGLDDWWSPFELGVGPAGAYLQSLDQPQRAALRAASNDRLGKPAGPFTLEARAWFAKGIVPS